VFPHSGDASEQHTHAHTSLVFVFLSTSPLPEIENERCVLVSRRTEIIHCVSKLFCLHTHYFLSSICQDDDDDDGDKDDENGGDSAEIIGDGNSFENGDASANANADDDGADRGIDGSGDNDDEDGDDDDDDDDEEEDEVNEWEGKPCNPFGPIDEEEKAMAVADRTFAKAPPGFFTGRGMNALVL
jgi:hypothetical protein